MRDLQRGSERAEREAQQAKDEVARLNGTNSSNASTHPDARKTGATARVQSGQRINATPEERKRQMAQLAAMGIAVPEDYRREMAMAGGWERIGERLLYEGEVNNRDDLKVEDSKTSSLNIGVRKRQRDEKDALDEEDEKDGTRAPRKNWGSSTREYPGGGIDDDLDSLLAATKKVKTKSGNVKPIVKSEENDEQTMLAEVHGSQEADKENGNVHVKEEDEATAATSPLSIDHVANEVPVATLFKKRKPKSTR